MDATKFWRGRGTNMGHVQTELKADILRITIDRPEKKNALTNAMYAALADAVEQGETNPDVRVMLLHGNGDSFTAGNDLEDFMANPWKGQAVPPALRFIAAVVGARSRSSRRFTEWRWASASPSCCIATWFMPRTMPGW